MSSLAEENLISLREDIPVSFEAAVKLPDRVQIGKTLPWPLVVSGNEDEQRAGIHIECHLRIVITNIDARKDMICNDSIWEDDGIESEYRVLKHPTDTIAVPPGKSSSLTWGVWHDQCIQEAGTFDVYVYGHAYKYEKSKRGDWDRVGKWRGLLFRYGRIVVTGDEVVEKQQLSKAICPTHISDIQEHCYGDRH